jgi:hypothetical protein
MATFSLKYLMEGAGWATAIVANKTESISMTVSYLHDSLCDLADATRSLIHGADSAKAIFMDEPGEHQLYFVKENDSISYEVRWFDDWASWDMHPIDKYTVVLRGKTTLNRVTGEIFNTLKYIYEEYSLEKYKEQWGEHDFPIYEFNQLKLLRETEHVN